MKAADLLREDHPLHKALVKFSKGNPTKRKARELLQRYPQFKEMKQAGEALEDTLIEDSLRYI